MIDKNELVIKRIFDAPVETVWRYWTEPEYFKKWWGPKDFTAPSIKIDFRVGGKYLYCMHGVAAPGAPAQDFWSTGIYREIVPMKKLVVTDSFADKDGNVVPATHYGMEGFPMELEVTVTFEELKDGPSTALRASKTKMTLKYPSIEGIEAKMLSDMTQGWNQSFDKLAQILRM